MTLATTRGIAHGDWLHLAGTSLLTRRCLRTLAISASSLVLFSLTARAEEPAGTVLQSLPGGQIVIQDEFWSPKLKLWRDVTIPDCFAKFDKDGTWPILTRSGMVVAASMEDRRGTTA